MIKYMKLFKNFKTAQEYYKYPGSYRIGTIHNEKGVIRSFSNNTYDIDKGNTFYYFIKNDKIKNAFKLNKNNGKKIRLFIKKNDYVVDVGLYKVDKFYKKYVKLMK